MSIEYKILKDANRVEFNMKTGFDINSYTEAFNRLFKDQEYETNMDSLWDLNLSDDADITMDAIKETEQFLMSIIEKRGVNYKVAIVCKNTAEAEVVEHFMVVIDRLPANVRAFIDKADAIAWLDL